MNYAFLAASGVSAFAVVLHVMLGRSRHISQPLTTGEDEAALRADAWFGRQVQTIILVLMAIGFGNASRQPDAADVVFWLSVLALLAGLLRLVLGLQSAAPRFGVSQWGLMALAGALGIVGLTI